MYLTAWQILYNVADVRNIWIWVFWDEWLRHLLYNILLHDIFGSFHSLSFDFNQERVAEIGLILPLSI